MKFDELIHRLLPKDDKFYVMLEESARHLIETAAVMKTLVAEADREKREPLVRKVKDLEHLGDAVAHRIFSELNATFVTPFDREDIHLLASALDDVLDHMDGCASRISLYKIGVMPPEIHKLVDILERSVQELAHGIHQLRKLSDSDEMLRVIKQINECENDADTVFGLGVARIFDQDTDPVTIIKLKEVFVGLETATDKCEDAANVLEAILIKHN